MSCGGGGKARGVHHRARAEQDAVAVDQEDAAVGGQAAEKFRWPQSAGDAIERHRRARGLIEADAFVGADIERVPVDDCAAARLVDDHRGAALALDRRAAADHRGAVGPGRDAHDAERHRSRRRGRRGCIASATAEHSGWGTVFLAPTHRQNAAGFRCRAGPDLAPTCAPDKSAVIAFSPSRPSQLS